MSEEQKVSAFKGFDKAMKCRGYQFEAGKTYTHAGKVAACKGGFHACENPLDVFAYYAPGESRFAVVEQSGDLSRHEDDSKVASRSIHIKAELNLPCLISAAFEFVKSKCEPAKEAHATGDSSASSATGDRSASSATGYRSASSATGGSSASSATGGSSASLTTGMHSRSEIKPTEEIKPLHAVAIATGEAGEARAPEGSAIVLCYRNDGGELLHIFASKVGENGIKPMVWYALDADGRPVEMAQ